MAQVEPYLQNIAYIDRYCEHLMALDSAVRFVGIADYAGKLLTSAYRKDLVPLMDKNETAQYAVQTVFRARTRDGFKSKLGSQLYSTAVYEKLVRVTITIDNDVEREYHNVYVLLSLDVGCEYQKVIESKIIPFITQAQYELFAVTRAFSEKYAEA